MSELLTRSESAKILGLKPRTLGTWSRKGILKPAFFVRGRPRYLLEDLEKVATQRQESYNTKPNGK